ncbi:hypothetical protein TREMEDRAFT_27348, partial [Tremella mesenterica DSM 1558]
MTSLETLPRNILSLITYHLVISTPHPLSSHYIPNPSTIIPLLLTCKTIYKTINFDSNPQLYNSLFRSTFDHSALSRRYDWMVVHLSEVAGRGRKIFDLFSNPRSWANEYKTRWGMVKRMRRDVRDCTVVNKEKMTADLWNVWFILTENAGNNLAFVLDLCQLQAWMRAHYHADMLADALVPGYPKETGSKALGIWCALLSGTDFPEDETPSEVDERIFIMRPYVFASAKYDITYAPWRHRKLPLCEPGCTCTSHTPDVSLRPKAIPYDRFGYTWKRAPPHFILGAYLMFFRLLERQPERLKIPLSDGITSSSPQTLPIHPPKPKLFSLRTILPSKIHDKEWQRNTVCQDPHTSPGLPPLTFRGDLQGVWKGRYLFYDFGTYRDILAGDMKAVYTGDFAEQSMEMKLKETVIKVRKEDVGGKGPLLSAGFEGRNEEEEELKRIENGYGNPVWDGKDENDEEGWTKEILISGRCKSSWGLASVKGRVRTWDGLVILSLTYSPHPMGKWLWRGYLHTGGYLVGRWRDTFTPENLRGYEGAFAMVR